MIETNILQTWKSKTDIPDNFRYWSGTVRTMNPDFAYCLWDDDDNRAFIASFYPWFLTTYDAYPMEIYRADAIRYFWLYHFGGVYIDMDSECLRPLDGLCRENGGVVLGRMGRDEQSGHSIPNAVMMSSRRESFWLLVMHLLLAPRATEVFGNPEAVTGPILLKAAVDACSGGWPVTRVDRAIEEVRSRLGADLAPRDGSTRLTILPPHCFYPIDWTNPLHQVRFRREVVGKGRVIPADRSAALFPDSYIVTYWAHSWAYADGSHGQ
jgi:hypothetical protein